MQTFPPKLERTLIYDEEGLKAFAKQLVSLRKKHGFSQESLAADSGLALSQIARIETAKINPTLSTVFAICRALKIPLSEVFDFKLPNKK